MDPHTVTLDELRALPELVGGAAVYFLWGGDELLYIGASRMAFERVARHGRERDYGHNQLNYKVRVPFDRHTMLKCDPSVVWQIEAALLNRFQPSFNPTLKVTEQL